MLFVVFDADIWVWVAFGLCFDCLDFVLGYGCLIVFWFGVGFVCFWWLWLGFVGGYFTC